MADRHWYRIGVFHLVPEEFLGTLRKHVEPLRDPTATASEIRHALFSLPRTWSPLDPCTVTVDLEGLSLEIPAIDVEWVLRRLPYLSPVPHTSRIVFPLAGDVRVLYLSEQDRQQLSASLRAERSGIQGRVREDLDTIARSVELLRAWQGPRRSAPHS